MPESLTTLVKNLSERDRWHLLTKRQKEIFLLHARGYTLTEISEKLHTTRQCIQRICDRAFDNLGGLTCQVDATLYAIKYDLIDSSIGGIKLKS